MATCLVGLGRSPARLYGWLARTVVREDPWEGGRWRDRAGLGQIGLARRRRHATSQRQGGQRDVYIRSAPGDDQLDNPPQALLDDVPRVLHLGCLFVTMGTFLAINLSASGSQISLAYLTYQGVRK
jgi:hypothetical protein